MKNKKSINGNDKNIAGIKKRKIEEIFPKHKLFTPH